MTLKEMLKKAWDKACKIAREIRDMRGPYDPASDVREKLEAKGYSFYDSYVSFPIATPGKVTYVTAPNGKPVGASYPDDAITNQYYRDYNQAESECKAARKAAQEAAAAKQKDGLKP